MPTLQTDVHFVPVDGESPTRKLAITLANQCDVCAITRGMVLPACRSALLLGTITNGNAMIQSVYVKVTHCQCAQMFLSMFHSE